MRSWLSALACLLLASACSKSEKTAEPAPTARTAATPLPSAPSETTVYSRMVSCTWNGKYADNFGEEVPAFECKSSAPKPLKQLQFWVYYYDETGKQLDRFAHSLEEGSGVLLEPGAHKTFTLGKAKPKEPVHAKKIEAEASRGTYSDGSSFSNPTLTPEERPLGG